ncbi:hypothetical protein CUC08_Gglean003276 [Alternaria sp. MG1]|nr:hypothetical protein CUC08_Gglean003276 [Alternaria sp. MG1]
MLWLRQRSDNGFLRLSVQAFEAAMTTCMSGEHQRIGYNICVIRIRVEDPQLRSLIEQLIHHKAVGGNEMYVRLSRRPLERFQPRARLVGARRGTASWLRCLHRARRACLRRVSLL